MKKNIGTKDRVARLILGIISFIVAYLIFKNAANDYQLTAVLFVTLFGIFCIFQATFSWCAWYALIGKNTCPIQK